MPVPVLHKVPTEYDTCIEWDAIDELEPIPSYISQQRIPMEGNIPTYWNIDALLPETMPKTIHLMKIDSIASCSVYMWHCTEHPVLWVYHCCITHVFLQPFWAISGGHTSDVVRLKHIILFADVTSLNDAVTSYVM